AVLRHTSPYYRPIQCIERREQGRRPIALVVVGHGASSAWDEWQARLGSVQRLNLTLLIHRVHHRVLGRVHIQTDDIVQLLQELRISPQLDSARQMRLQTILPPHSTNNAWAKSHHLGQAAGAPMSPALWILIICLPNDLRNHLLAN